MLYSFRHFSVYISGDMTHNLTHGKQCKVLHGGEKDENLWEKKKYLPSSDIMHSFHFSKLFSSTILCAVNFKSSIVNIWFSISQLQNTLHTNKNDKAVYRFNVHFKSECEMMKSHRFVATIQGFTFPGHHIPYMFFSGLYSFVLVFLFHFRSRRDELMGHMKEQL